MDPFATGVLLILVGFATRLMEYVNLLSKTYEAELTLGATSDTDDITGKISKSKVKSQNKIPMTQIQKTLASFLGPQQQIPPPYSAVKIKGEKAYQAARRGSPLKLPARHITIHNIQLINYNYPALSIKVACSSGTYIRALARDIGNQLATGAYLSKLRRTSIGIPATKPNTNMKQKSEKFDIKSAIKLDQLTADNLTSHLLPSSTLVAHLPSVILSQPNVAQHRKGQPIEWGTILPEQKPIALFTKDNQLFGIGHYDPITKLLSPQESPLTCFLNPLPS